jgi:hypothetical protein
MWIFVYPTGLDLERYPCPWILSWMGHGEAGGSGFGSDFAIFVQTSSIAIFIVS